MRCIKRSKCLFCQRVVDDVELRNARFRAVARPGQLPIAEMAEHEMTLCFRAGEVP